MKITITLCILFLLFSLGYIAILLEDIRNILRERLK